MENALTILLKWAEKCGPGVNPELVLIRRKQDTALSLTRVEWY